MHFLYLFIYHSSLSYSLPENPLDFCLCIHTTILIPHVENLVVTAYNKKVNRIEEYASIIYRIEQRVRCHFMFIPVIKRDIYHLYQIRYDGIWLLFCNICKQNGPCYVIKNIYILGLHIPGNMQYLINQNPSRDYQRWSIKYSAFTSGLCVSK